MTILRTSPLPLITCRFDDKEIEIEYDPSTHLISVCVAGAVPMVEEIDNNWKLIRDEVSKINFIVHWSTTMKDLMVSMGKDRRSKLVYLYHDQFNSNSHY